MAPRWDQYVESTYPHPRQEYVYTSTDLRVSFLTRMPYEAYQPAFYKKVNGQWEKKTRGGVPYWRYEGRAIQCRECLEPQTEYELRITKVSTGEEAYKLAFKTSAYEYFKDMIDASDKNPRVGIGMSAIPPYLFWVSTFNTVEPINWLDVEGIYYSTSQPGSQGLLGQAEITVNRDVFAFFNLWGNGYAFTVPSVPVHISTDIKLKGTHYKSFYGDHQHSIHHFCDYENLVMEPDLNVIRAMYPSFTLVRAGVKDLTLSDVEKDLLWSALGPISSSFILSLQYRDVFLWQWHTSADIAGKLGYFHITIPKDRLNHR